MLGPWAHRERSNRQRQAWQVEADRAFSAVSTSRGQAWCKYYSLQDMGSVWCKDAAHFSVEGADQILEGGLEDQIIDLVSQ